ncbi:MAG TPA: histidine phosphatase family protein [Planctomycetaceae bacterium]|jgi:phosphohistidine phosphatase
MHLWLVRHAVAADRDEFDGPDGERPLTSKGRRRFRRFCQCVVRQTATPEYIFSSPLVRAAQTARLLAKAYGLKKSAVQLTDLLAPGVDVGELLRFVRDLPADRIALVGHEPDMSTILAELVGGGAFHFDKGFVAAIEFNSLPLAGDGRLAWFVGPRLD